MCAERDEVIFHRSASSASLWISVLLFLQESAVKAAPSRYRAPPGAIKVCVNGCQDDKQDANDSDSR